MYSRPDEAIAEKVHAAEKDAAMVRIAVIALNTFVFAFLLSWEHVITWLAISLLSVAWVYGLFVHVAKPYRRFPILLSSYFTSLTDALLITGWLHATGGFDSQFYVLWYVSIAAIAYRWNSRDTVIAGVIYGLSYIGLVAAHGQLSGHYAELTVRVGYIFLVGALGMLLSGEMMDQIKAKVQLRQVVAQAAAAEAKFRGLLDSAPDPIIIANKDGRIVIVNAVVEKTFGYSRNEILGQPIEMIIPAEFRREHSDHWTRYSANPERRHVLSISSNARGLRKDGSEFPVDIRLSPTQTRDGLLVTAIIRDMSERHAVQAALEESEERFRRLSEVTLEGVVIHENGVILDVNRAGASMFGHEVADMIGQSTLSFLAPESQSVGLARLQGPPPDDPRRLQGLRKDGTSFPIEVQVREYRWGGRTVRVSAVRDITEQLKAETALQQSEARFRALIENASDFILIIGMSGVIHYVSPSVRRMGYHESDLVGRVCFDFIHPDDVPDLLEIFRSRLSDHGVGIPIEFRVRRSDGEWRILEAIGNFDQLNTPEVGGVILNARDVTDRKSAEEAVTHQAYHDSLTALPNRALLADRLATAVAQQRRQREMLAVVFLDIDHFKLVNDTLGHVGGDELLQIIARELSLLVRDGDTVARVGGDEFVLLLSPLSAPREAIDIAQRILATLDKRRAVLGHELRVTTSIGISLYPEHGEDPDTLLANADIAMYQAKDRGRNGYQLYENPMKEQVVGRLAMVNDLRNALERDEFVVHCQPIVSVDSGKIVSAEALVRWQHPVRGLVFPDAFIPLIADGDLIAALDEWVLRQSCRQAASWREAGSDIRLAVNLSARTIQRPDLVGLVRRVLGETGLPPSGLALEITESAVMANVEAAVVSLRELQALGVAISVDDFGTGYSSLSYLKRFPIETVKIDRSFITDLTADPSDAAIVSAIISMAHSLNLRVIAEGVETPEQLAFLSDRGCDEFQGYLFARPQSPADFAGLLGQAAPSGRRHLRVIRSPSGTS